MLHQNLKIMNTYTIEFFTKGNKQCAYIGSDNGSGYECVADTKELLIDQIKEFFIMNL